VTTYIMQLVPWYSYTTEYEEKASSSHFYPRGMHGIIFFWRIYSPLWVNTPQLCREDARLVR
jgi:hypothetical protein